MNDTVTLGWVSYEVYRVQKFGGLFPAIGRASQRWDCNGGTVLCDTLAQAVAYFAHQPWAEEATEFRIHFVPWPPKKGHSESYRVVRSLRAGWELVAR